MRNRVGFLALAALALAACGPGGGGGTGGGTDPCRLSGTIVGTVELSPGTCDPYRVVGDLEVPDGGVLKIHPGTALVFEQDTGLSVTGHGQLVAEGTAAQPVAMRGAQPIPGYWKGLVFEDADSFANKLEHVEIRDAAGADRWDNGAFGAYRAAVRLLGQSRLLAKFNKVWKNDGAAFFVDDEVDFRQGFDRNTLTANQGFPLLIYASRVGQIGASNDFSGNAAGKDYVRVAGYGEVHTATWLKLNVPYRVMNEVVVADGARLSIAPGTRLVFEQDARLTIDGYTGALTAVGTATDPIVFTGLLAQKGYWCGLYFHDTHSTENRLENVVVEYGGGDAAACASQSAYYANILIDSSGNASSQYLKIKDGTVRKSRHYGIVIPNTATTDFTHVTYSDNTDGNTITEHY